MLTQLESARKGMITDEMKRAAQAEQVDADLLRSGIAAGKIILLCNVRHEGAEPLAIGQRLRTKVNANIGSSKDEVDPELECEKARRAMEAG